MRIHTAYLLLGSDTVRGPQSILLPGKKKNTPCGASLEAAGSWQEAAPRDDLLI